MLEISKQSFASISSYDEFYLLLEEYASECEISEVGMPTMQADMYEAMDSSDRFFIVGAVKDGKLIGFVNVAMSVLPHYGKMVAATESFFVSKEFRSTGAGVKLLAKAEEIAKDNGAIAMLVSAHTNSSLDSLLAAKKSYRETNRIFTKCLH